jgi:hypothetical protein
VTTRRGDEVFVHILDWADRVLSLPAFDRRVVNARMLATGEAVPFVESAADPPGPPTRVSQRVGVAVTLTLPAAGAADPDRVVVLETRAR